MESFSWCCSGLDLSREDAAEARRGTQAPRRSNLTQAKRRRVNAGADGGAPWERQAPAWRERRKYLSFRREPESSRTAAVFTETTGLLGARASLPACLDLPTTRESSCHRIHKVFPFVIPAKAGIQPNCRTIHRSGESMLSCRRDALKAASCRRTPCASERTRSEGEIPSGQPFQPENQE